MLLASTTLSAPTVPIGCDIFADLDCLIAPLATAQRRPLPVERPMLRESLVTLYEAYTAARARVTTELFLLEELTPSPSPRASAQPEDARPPL